MKTFMMISAFLNLMFSAGAYASCETVYTESYKAAENYKGSLENTLLVNTVLSNAIAGVPGMAGNFIFTLLERHSDNGTDGLRNLQILYAASKPTSTLFIDGHYFSGGGSFPATFSVTKSARQNAEEFQGFMSELRKAWTSRPTYYQPFNNPHIAYTHPSLSTVPTHAIKGPPKCSVDVARVTDEVVMKVIADLDSRNALCSTAGENGYEEHAFGKEGFLRTVLAHTCAYLKDPAYFEANGKLDRLNRGF